MKHLQIIYVFFSVLWVLSTAVKPNIGFFWHITDVHYDINYSGLDRNSTKRCRSTYSNNSMQSPGMFGEFHCDSPSQLFTSAVDAMVQKAGSTPDFILWTGGNHCTNKDNSSLDSIYDAIEFVYSTLTSASENILVYPCMGRNDYWPYGHHPALAKKPSFYQKLMNLFKFWIFDEAMDTFVLSGYYSRVMNPHSLRIIVLNTNFLVEDHIGCTFSNPGDMWTWFERELIFSRRDGQKVYVVMSIPPGVVENAYHMPNMHWFHPRHNRAYISIVRRYMDVIKGQFAGHLHSDTFRVLYNKFEKPMSWIMMSPSINPRNVDLAPHVTTYNNPGIRLYMYDTETLDVLDYTQYFLNLTAANLREQAVWIPAYTFTAYYAVPNMSMYSFHLLLTRLNQDSRYFARYYEANSLFLYGSEACNKFCVHYHLCAIQNVDYSSFLECISAPDVSSFLYSHVSSGTPLPPNFVSLFTLVCVMLTTYMLKMLISCNVRQKFTENY